MQAAGKSTVAPLLASRLDPRAVTVDGDVFYRGVVAGRVGMTPTPDAEALRQLRLRYEATALLGQHYLDAGFNFVCSDIILGADVVEWMDSFAGSVERHLVVLVPSIASIVERELLRGGANSYRDWQTEGMTLADAVASLQQGLADTPRRGLWLDTTGQSPDESVNEILRNDLGSSRWS